MGTLQSYRNFKARKIKNSKHQAKASGQLQPAWAKENQNSTTSSDSSSVTCSTDLHRTNPTPKQDRKLRSRILSEIFYAEPHIEHQATSKTIQASLIERVKDPESAEELVSELLELLEDDSLPVPISDNLHFCVEHLQTIARKHDADKKEKQKSRHSLQILDRDNLKKEDLELLTKKWAQVKKTIQVQMVKNEEDKKKIEFNNRCEAYVEVCIHTNMVSPGHQHFWICSNMGIRDYIQCRELFKKRTKMRMQCLHWLLQSRVYKPPFF